MGARTGFRTGGRFSCGRRFESAPYGRPIASNGLCVASRRLGTNDAGNPSRGNILPSRFSCCSAARGRRAPASPHAWTARPARPTVHAWVLRVVALAHSLRPDVRCTVGVMGLAERRRARRRNKGTSSSRSEFRRRAAGWARGESPAEPRPAERGGPLSRDRWPSGDAPAPRGPVVGLLLAAHRASASYPTSRSALRRRTMLFE